MMDRVSTRFAACAAQGRAALVTFVTAGDPDLATSAAILRALVASGADIVELGMPFTDPMADGAAIQLGNIRSLCSGTKLRDVLAMVADFRRSDDATPIILMGYFNPILAYGPSRFAADARAAGLDGTIVVDLPPEEAAELVPDLSAHGLHLIRLATPTTDSARLPRVLDGASGFLYYVAVAGVTGANAAAATDIADAVTRLKRSTDLPIAVGFGVRTPDQAAAIAAHADAVVVGSAIVDTIGAAAEARANDIPARVGALVADLAAAVRGARPTKEQAA
ncbi:tryptophan synthase subunit alpha [Polymorphobacter fuscus]|uniref:Tryptophan synthase alpha chain n=1 Tax=Sandarakinorhabdus fusca TaxID=1439888 RepID=A0A7C9KJ79_9SPHN|nr:tryptophan synthase subunit alpha [Polymorphobacter fuscus]KAB7645455.1 tryptophan synthase subunit alpha [Polymorphobacter fuscus]MQT17879.1 tryptophan synthase subunit alpha [Polymorphobacter fuscus]NJC08508.1 tryptophan synthase alpha chain [Polymorphobacter fuscus]